MIKHVYKTGPLVMAKQIISINHVKHIISIYFSAFLLNALRTKSAVSQSNCFLHEILVLIYSCEGS